MHWTEYILFAVVIVGTMANAWLAIRKPQEATEKTDAVFKVRIDGMESNIKRILENHLPHIDAKISGMQTQMAMLDKSVVQLSTIIDERIPKK